MIRNVQMGAGVRKRKFVTVKKDIWVGEIKHFLILIIRLINVMIILPGQYCQTALCYPNCQNGGSCSAPGGNLLIINFNYRS